MRKFKLNDYCEFPMNLDMYPYTKEGVAALEGEEGKSQWKSNFVKHFTICSSSSVSVNKSQTLKNILIFIYWQILSQTT